MTPDLGGSARVVGKKAGSSGHLPALTHFLLLIVDVATM